MFHLLDRKWQRHLAHSCKIKSWHQSHLPCGISPHAIADNTQQSLHWLRALSADCLINCLFDLLHSCGESTSINLMHPAIHLLHVPIASLQSLHWSCRAGSPMLGLNGKLTLPIAARRSAAVDVTRPGIHHPVQLHIAHSNYRPWIVHSTSDLTGTLTTPASKRRAASMHHMRHTTHHVVGL